MTTNEGITPSPSNKMRAAQVIVVGSVMFTFISYWRTAAVVLCDLASTAYYIGGIVEAAVGPAAPWFILAVMVFSYAVRWVYIESCALFVRGGVYRVVGQALGHFAAKLAVSALMFDYILTGPISGVSAGQYLIGLGLDSLKLVEPSWELSKDNKEFVKQWVSVVIAILITLYFFRQNILGIHESSDKAMKIMIATTIMGVVILVWCGITLAINGPAKGNPGLPTIKPDLSVKSDPETNEKSDPLGFMPHVLPESWVAEIRRPGSVFSILGCVGLFIAFGHSILAMSGEETLAQVYREVESPKLPNFQKAAFIVFIYSILLTGTISFLAVILIPDNQRLSTYQDNLIGGLAMNVIGPNFARVFLNAFVTVIGFAILSGAVNTSIIGSNGVLNRVAEDGVLPDWFLKPHSKYGTTYRVLVLIVGLQLFTIIASRGRMDLLGEAYAFGVIWSFVFQAFSMLVLRFKDKRPREFKVPGNIRIRGVEIPVLLGAIFLVLLFAGILNFLTKEIATIGGMIFSGIFFTIFTISERYHQNRRKGAEHHHLEQFNQQTAEEVSPNSLGLKKPYRKLVAIRSPQNLYMLEKTLAETDPETTDVIVMTSKVTHNSASVATDEDLDRYDQELMTAVVNLAEKAGKEVTPLIVPTNNPFFAVIRTAKELMAQELIMGASNKYNADEQLEQIGFYWISLHDGTTAPLTVRILSRERDMFLDLSGGNRIPTINERQARSVAELRAAGVGVDRVLLVYDGSPTSSDLFEGVMTMLDPKVALGLVALVPPGTEPHNGHHLVHQDRERAKQLDRALQDHEIKGDPGPGIVALAGAEKYDVVILSLPEGAPSPSNLPLPSWAEYVVRHAHCRVFLTPPPLIPHDIVDKTVAPAS